MTDTILRSGGVANPAGGIISADQVTVFGDGTAENPIRAGSVVPRLVFRPGSSDVGVFSTWVDLYAALLSVIGSGTIYLEFDDSIEPCVIPSGVWNMSGVVWTNAIESAPIQPVTRVELADGASIVMTAPSSTLRIEGYGLEILCDRTGPVAPFVGINLLLDGFGVRLFNTDTGALPMWVGDGANAILISGSCARAQIGNGQGSPPCPAPLIDVAGGVLGITAGGGLLFNGSLTDSVGGGFIFARSLDDSFNGGGGADTTFDFPDLISGGGEFDGTAVEHRDRHLVDAALATGTWDAFLNELVRADTSGGAVTVNAPPASAPGNRLTVKDFSGNAAANNITVVPQGSDTVESATITTNSQAKTWVSDGQGTWMLISTST